MALPAILGGLGKAALGSFAKSALGGIFGGNKGPDPAAIRRKLMQDLKLDQRYFKPGQQLMGQGMSMMQGQGPILDAMRTQMRKGIYDQSATQGRNINQQMASMGISPFAMGGGQGSVLTRMLQNRGGENIAGGLLGISKYGMDQGLGMIGQGKGFYDTGSQLLSGANVGATQQYGQNIADQNQFIQQMLEPAYGAIGRGIETGIEDMTGGIGDMFGDKSS